jgi:hypothetical protein
LKITDLEKIYSRSMNKNGLIMTWNSGKKALNESRMAFHNGKNE